MDWSRWIWEKYRRSDHLVLGMGLGEQDFKNEFLISGYAAKECGTIQYGGQSWAEGREPSAEVWEAPVRDAQKGRMYQKGRQREQQAPEKNR